MSSAENVSLAGAEPEPAPRDPFVFLLETHARIERRLDLLEAAGRELVEGSNLAQRQLALLCESLAFLDLVLPVHEADEEQTLFSVLRAKGAFRESPSPLDGVHYEHACCADRTRDLKAAITRNDPLSAGRHALQHVREIRHHMRIEEEVLYPWARRFLADDEALGFMHDEMLSRHRTAGLSW